MLLRYEDYGLDCGASKARQVRKMKELKADLKEATSSVKLPATFQPPTTVHTKTRTLTEHLKECEVQGCVSAGKTDISCVVCGRWAHRECCNITRGTAYVCIICEAVCGV